MTVAMGRLLFVVSWSLYVGRCGLVAVGCFMLCADRFVTIALCHLWWSCGTMAVGSSL